MGLLFLYLVPMLLGMVIGTGLMIASMRIASHLRGGLDFGDLEPAVFKGAFLVGLALGFQVLTPYGNWLALAVWTAGLFLLFRVELWTTIVLILINWFFSVALVAVFTRFMMLQ